MLNMGTCCYRKTGSKPELCQAILELVLQQQDQRLQKMDFSAIRKSSVTFSSNPNVRVMYNSTYVQNYWSIGTTWISFNDVEAIRAKISNAKSKKLAGTSRDIPSITWQF